MCNLFFLATQITDGNDNISLNRQREDDDTTIREDSLWLLIKATTKPAVWLHYDPMFPKSEDTRWDTNPAPGPYGSKIQTLPGFGILTNGISAIRLNDSNPNLWCPLLEKLIKINSWDQGVCP